jgi:hypothetical protein
MHKAVFTIDCYPKAYIGYTSGRTWNGFATPHFELEEAKRVAEGNNEMAEYPILYDEANDQFFIAKPKDESKEFKKFTTFEEFVSLGDEIWEFEIEDKWKGEDIQTEEGIKHLYGIGAYSWVWDEATDRDCKWLAEGIEDFIYEYDTYGYRDVGIDREEMVEAIKNQLKELKTFQQIYEVWKNEDLSAEEMFEKLSKLLTV